MQYVILAGNPINGFEVFGPFDSERDASNFANSLEGGEWWLTLLTSPDI